MKSKFLIIVSLCVFISMYVYADPTSDVATPVQDSSQSPKMPTRRSRAIPIKTNQEQAVNALRKAAAAQNNPGQESTGSGQSELVRGVNPFAQKVNAPVVAVKKNTGQRYLEQIQQAKNLNVTQPQMIESQSQVADKIQYFEGLKGQLAQLKSPVARRPGPAQAAAAQKSANQVVDNQQVPVNDVNAPQQDYASNYNSSSDFGNLYQPSTIVAYANNDLRSPVGMGDLYNASIIESGANAMRSKSQSVEAAPSMGDMYPAPSGLGLNTPQRDNSYNPLRPSKSQALVPYDPSQKLQQPIEASRPAPLYEPQSIHTGVVGGKINKYNSSQIIAAQKGVQSLALSSNTMPIKDSVDFNNFTSITNFLNPGAKSSFVNSSAVSAQSKKSVNSKVANLNSGLTVEQNAMISKQNTDSALNIVARNNANFQRQAENAQSAQHEHEAMIHGF